MVKRSKALSPLCVETGEREREEEKGKRAKME